MRKNKLPPIYTLSIYKEVEHYLDRLCWVKEKYPDRNLPAPHMLFGQNEEESFGVAAEYITERLYQNHIIEFRSKKRMVECVFSQDINVRELRDKIRAGTVISNVFYGVAAIDLKMSFSSIAENSITELVSFLKENEDNICFLIRVKKEELGEAKCLMTGIRGINFCSFAIPEISCPEMADIIFNWMKEDGFTAEDELRKVLLRMIEFLYEQKQYFDLRMTRQLTKRLEAYHVMSDNGRKMFTAQEIKEFIDGELLTELNYRGTSAKHKIGF